MNNRASDDGAGYYSDDFYEGQMEGSYRSAKKFVELLYPLHAPRSVVDVGCGRGTWLKAFKDKGAETLVGFDGRWNSQANMVDPSIHFHCIDLTAPSTIVSADRYDLALSLEVAEHLPAAVAERFVRALVQLSDVVLFGAAYTSQGGTNHVNEQPQVYWGRQFGECGYLVFDLFRPAFWGDADIEFWYQQNTFLYVQKDCPLVGRLAERGIEPLANLEFMNCVHPTLYAFKLADATVKATIRRAIIDALPPALRAAARRLKSVLFR